MTAWKTWQRRPSGIPRARAIEQPSARMAKFWAEKSSSPSTAAPISPFRLLSFPAVQFTRVDRTTGKTFASAPKRLPQMRLLMERIAQVVGVSPVEIRRRNFLQPGQTTTTEQVIREPINLEKLLDHALEISDYHTKKQRFTDENRLNNIRHGMGIATFLHGAGFTGSGERYLSSVVGVEGCAD